MWIDWFAYSYSQQTKNKKKNTTNFNWFSGWNRRWWWVAKKDSWDKSKDWIKVSTSFDKNRKNSTNKSETVNLSLWTHFLLNFQNIYQHPNDHITKSNACQMFLHIHTSHYQNANLFTNLIIGKLSVCSIAHSCQKCSVRVRCQRILCSVADKISILNSLVNWANQWDDLTAIHSAVFCIMDTRRKAFIFGQNQGNVIQKVYEHLCHHFMEWSSCIKTHF